MITLKTNYVDAVLDVDVNTKRKYQEIKNSDGTISLDDKTTYSQKGDTFAALDINNTNKAIIESRTVKQVTIPSNGWSDAAPFKNTVTVSGIKSADMPVIAPVVTGSPTSATVKAMMKAYGMIDRATTADNSITFYCYNKKPTVNITVSVKGV